MQKSITILASALLLGYLVTELSARFFADSYFALLVISIAALAINGVFVTQVTGAQRRPSKNEPAESRQGQRDRNNQPRNNPPRNNPSRTDTPRRNESRGDNQNRRDRPPAEKSRDEKPRAAQERKESTPPAPTGPTEDGEVKWFNRSKGYGFIIRPNAEEIFVHQRSILSDDNRARPALRDGQKVRYVVVDGERGAQAEHVQPRE